MIVRSTSQRSQGAAWNPLGDHRVLPGRRRVSRMWIPGRCATATGLRNLRRRHGAGLILATLHTRDGFIPTSLTRTMSAWRLLSPGGESFESFDR